MKKIHEMRNEQYHSAMDKIFEGKKLTNAEVEALAIHSVLEFGCMPGQVQDGDFPHAYGYVPGIDSAALADSRRVDWGDMEPSEIDVANHVKFVTYANNFYWSLRVKYFG